ncbi:hypothetical protein QL285_090927 [Trifolium repens]|nr:hypothetical protein QL285_090927 [Trifolium repens]
MTSRLRLPAVSLSSLRIVSPLILASSEGLYYKVTKPLYFSPINPGPVFSNVFAGKAEKKFAALLCCLHSVAATFSGSFPTPPVVSLLPALRFEQKIGFWLRIILWSKREAKGCKLAAAWY